MLTLKSTKEKTDSAKISDIDFSQNEKLYKDALEEWDSVVRGIVWDAVVKGTNYKDYPPYLFMSKDDLISVYKNRETYATVNACFFTYAIVTPDGKWNAQGQMGWLGLDSSSVDEERDWRVHFKERFIDTADPDWLLTIVDCHI